MAHHESRFSVGDKITILREEVELLRRRREEDMYITYTIRTIERRIEELENDMKETIRKGYISSYEQYNKGNRSSDRYNQASFECEEVDHYAVQGGDVHP